MALLMVMRHGQAQPGAVDRERSLTNHGILQVRAQAHAVLNTHSIDRVLVSPYRRTQETANVILESNQPNKVDTIDAIRSGASVAEAMSELREIPIEHCWLMVSHMPLVAQLSESLIDSDQRLIFSTATIAVIEFEYGLAPNMGTLLGLHQG